MKRKTSNSEQPSPSSELPKKNRSLSNADESDPMATDNRSNLTASQQDAERLAYEDRWSRLLHAVGAEALKRFQSGKILVSGLKGLGLEIGTRRHRRFGIFCLLLSSEKCYFDGSSHCYYP
jgi:hypothetical protein